VDENFAIDQALGKAFADMDVDRDGDINMEGSIEGMTEVDGIVMGAGKSVTGADRCMSRANM
jgi:hypothetical protein